MAWLVYISLVINSLSIRLETSLVKWVDHNWINNTSAVIGLHANEFIDN